MNYLDKLVIVTIIMFGLVGLYLFIKTERRITRDEKQHTAEHLERMARLDSTYAKDEARLARHESWNREPKELPHAEN